MRAQVVLLGLLLLAFGAGVGAMLRSLGETPGGALFYAAAATVSAGVVCWGVRLGLRRPS